jgi:hypothetical protein
MDAVVGGRWSHEKKEYTYFSFFGQYGPYQTSYSHIDWKAALNYRWTLTPGAPTATKAARQLTCSAIQPPSMEPNTTPMGAPSQIRDMAEARRIS